MKPAAARTRHQRALAVPTAVRDTTQADARHACQQGRCSHCSSLFPTHLQRKRDAGLAALLLVLAVGTLSADVFGRRRSPPVPAGYAAPLRGRRLSSLRGGGNTGLVGLSASRAVLCFLLLAVAVALRGRNRGWLGWIDSLVPRQMGCDVKSVSLNLKNTREP